MAFCALRPSADLEMLFRVETDMHQRSENERIGSSEGCAVCAEMSPGKPLFFATDEDRDGTDPFTDTYDQSLYPIEYFEDTLSLIGTLIPTARNRTTAVSEPRAPCLNSL